MNQNVVEIYIENAVIAERAERYQDMLNYMRKCVEATTSSLSSDARNLLYVAYKNVIGSCSASWRVISAIEGSQRERNPYDHHKIAIIMGYKKRIESEMDAICQDAHAIINVCLSKESKFHNSCIRAIEGQVFYYKMRGDYYRYQAEYKSEGEKFKASECANIAYSDALRIIEENNASLEYTNPVRLELALSYSIFHFEILNKPEEACLMAKKAFDFAFANIESMREDTCKDSTLAMQLLADNLTIWTYSQSEFNCGAM